MESGCRFDLTSNPLDYTTPEFAAVIASRLSDRRRKLLELAQENFEAFEGLASGDVRMACQPPFALHLMTPVLQFLPSFELTIPMRPFITLTGFHCDTLQYSSFAVFFENGFRDYVQHDPFERTPVMVWRPNAFNDWDPESFIEGLEWLRESGFLDAIARDSANMGLNAHATGWHYVAVMMAASLSSGPEFHGSIPEILINKFSEVDASDQCACWCSPGRKAVRLSSRS